MASKPSKVSQFSLGTDKIKLTTESSHNYRHHQLQLDSPSSNKKDIKASHFTFGSFAQNYSTTASTAFEFPQSSLRESCKTPSKNIHFGNEKVKKISMVQSEFTAKPSNMSGQLESFAIKASQDNSHFSFGSFQNDYQSTNRDYRAFSSTPTRKGENFNNSVSVVLGNFKESLKTEMQVMFKGKEKERNSSQQANRSFYMKQANFLLGTCKETTTATSKEAYKGEQINNRETAQDLPARKNNVVLGKDVRKWHSSYQKAFDEKEVPCNGKIVTSKKNNFDLGYHNERQLTIAQESFSIKTYENTAKIVRPEMIYLGAYKNPFKTGNSAYGASLPKV
jgi:hypothetical protein